MPRTGRPAPVPYASGGAPLPYELRSLGYPRDKSRFRGRPTPVRIALPGVPPGQVTLPGAPHSRTNCAPWGTPGTSHASGGTPLPYELRSLGYPRDKSRFRGHPTPVRIALPGVPPGQVTLPGAPHSRTNAPWGTLGTVTLPGASHSGKLSAGSNHASGGSSGSTPAPVKRAAISRNSSLTSRNASNTSGSKYVPRFSPMVRTASSWVSAGL